jgi:hypothetical protein
MRPNIYIAVLILFAFACKKENLNIELTSHTEQKIVGEGYFTDSLKKHQFQFTVSNNLGSTNLNYPNEVSLLIKTPEGVRNFSRIGDGLFESDEAFKGEYGANYTIQFSYKGDVHEVETPMPSPIIIDTVNYQVFDSLNGYSGQGEISMNVDSDVEQYMQFKLFKANIDPFTDDTTWFETPLPVYRIAKINAGENVTVTLPIENYDSFYLTAGDYIRIETSIISKDVGEYLLRLKNYVQNELINNQSYNAPFYYTNEAYGLGYGTILDSLFHQY